MVRWEGFCGGDVVRWGWFCGSGVGRVLWGDVVR